MTDEAQLAALRAEVTRQRQAIAELEEQSARLAGLLIDMPKLFAAREPDALIAACAEAARSATGAVFALFVASEGDQVQTLVGTEWADSLVASLPPDQRAVVALRVTADLPLEQVARILDKRVGAVKALQHRALAALRRRCEEALT